MFSVRQHIIKCFCIRKSRISADWGVPAAYMSIRIGDFIVKGDQFCTSRRRIDDSPDGRMGERQWPPFSRYQAETFRHTNRMVVIPLPGFLNFRNIMNVLPIVPEHDVSIPEQFGVKFFERRTLGKRLRIPFSEERQNSLCRWAVYICENLLVQFLTT